MSESPSKSGSESRSERDSAPDAAGGGEPGVLRWLVLAAIVGAVFWFGVKALRETPEAGSEDGKGSGSPSGPPPATVMVMAVEKRTERETRRVTGTLRAVARARVAARESGAVAEVQVDEGDSVERNALLAVLDQRRLDAEFAEAQALLTAAESVLVQRQAEAARAATDLDRKRPMRKSGAVSEAEFLDAEREQAVAAAGVTAASNNVIALTSALRLLEVRRGDLEIRAPFAGRIVERHVEAGEWLSAGSAVVTLVSTGEVEAWLNVPERFAASISEDADGLKVVAEDAGLKSPVKHMRRVADIDPQTRLFPVVATLDDLDGALAAGMSVYVDLPVSAADEHLAIPVDALVVAREQAFVFRPASADESGKALPIAEKVVVRELFRRDGLVFVESEPLNAGDSVVVEGNERLFPGTPLIIAENPAAAEESPDEGAGSFLSPEP